MKRLMLTVAMVMMALTVSAQGVTVVRVYVVPKAGTGIGHDGLHPKYFREAGVSDWEQLDYGLEDAFLVVADVTPTQHTSLASNLDVIALPQDLTQPIGPTALTTVQQKLEGLHIPAGWVTEGMTYKQILTVVGKGFLFMERFDGINGRTFFEAGITLDTRINQLTQAQRNALVATADSFGLDTSGVTGPMLVRQALKLIWDQLPGFTLHGQQF